MLRIFCGLMLALFLAGCGTGGLAEEESTSGGQAMFQQKCGACHALAAAGTLGNPAIRAPNLDAAFAASRAEGFDETTIREVVLGQMRFPIPPMPQPDAPEMFPSSEFSDDERNAAMSAIASYVASVAANEEAIAQARRDGGGSADDPEALFTTNCSSCHVLAAAGASGTIGPSLDESTMDIAAIAEQIRNGGGGMPAFGDQLTDEQIEALAAYVAESRGG